MENVIIKKVFLIFLLGIFGMFAGKIINRIINRLPLLIKPQPAKSSAITLRYYLVEILSVLATVSICFNFGFYFATISLLIITWLLLALIFIDIEHQLLPDHLTLTGLWLGLGFNTQQLFATTQDAVLGAIAGYLILWFTATLFKLIRKQEGMGHGDFKLLALLGAWLGWQMLPFIIFLSSLTGIITGMIIILLKKQQRNIAISFGPHLGFAGLIAFFWGRYYLTL
jgi:leader peptidase (prepilin peptidase)/N-methyltransferase